MVQHFKWVAKSKRRIQAKPAPVEIAACRRFVADLAMVRRLLG